MKIKAVKAIPLTFDERRAVKYLFELPLNFLFIRVESEEGHVGYGEVCDSYGCNYPLVVKAIVDEALSPLLIGEDPEEIGRLCAKMRGWTRRRLGDQGVMVQAISGVEIALWDLLGKINGKSVSRLMGRVRDKIPVYASSTVMEEGPGEVHLQLVEPYIERGVRAVKVRLGLNFREDLKTLREVRRLIGEDIQLMVDGGEHYTTPTALEISHALADFNVRFFEEPVPQNNREGIARLVEKSPVPIAYGEHLFLLQDFQDCLAHKRADIIQPDVAVCGGIAECVRIAALGDAFGAPVVPHCAAGPLALAANLHFCATVPNVSMLEYTFTFNRIWKAMLQEPLLSPENLENGHLRVPDGPGLGVTINEEIWEQYPYQPRTNETKMPSWSLGRV